jgi:hypothetical protein
MSFCSRSNSDSLRCEAASWASQFAVSGFADYRAKLEKAFVILDAAARRAKIFADASAEAAKLGVTKNNIDTDGRLVWTRVHREYFCLYPENFDLRPVGKVFMAEYAKFIAGKNKKLGSAGQLDSAREFIKSNTK